MIEDLEPAARQLMGLSKAVTDDMLDAPTPCELYTVRDLLGPGSRHRPAV
jgi:hypothetical protein